MPFAFLPTDASVEAALRRVAREEAEGALGAVGGEGDLGPRVHEMRKAVKKLRGLLRLVRPVLPDAREEDGRLRDAGRALSELRDAAVQLAVAERLGEGMEAGRREAFLLPFRRVAAEQDARAAEAALPAFAAAMGGLRDRAGAWTLDADGWDAIGPGLERTWRGARRAMRAAGNGDAEAAHEWRKRAKDHWYQARLLEPIWPALMKPHVAAADELGEVLGQANDLAVLDARLDHAGLDAGLLWDARDRAAQRRRELMEAAWPLGRRLFAGPAEAVSGRWRQWWRLRGEPA